MSIIRTLARARELEAQERAEIRQSLEADHAAGRPHGRFSDDDDENMAATALAQDEEARIGFTDLDDDHVDLALDDSDNERPVQGKKNQRTYRDEFTDNDSDEFPGEADETYGLHSHVQRG